MAAISPVMADTEISRPQLLAWISAISKVSAKRLRLTHKEAEKNLNLWRETGISASDVENIPKIEISAADRLPP